MSDGSDVSDDPGDDNVVRVHFGKNASVVCALEQMLALAKAGTLTGLVAIGIDNGEIISGWAGDTPPYQTIGALRVLEHEFLREMLDE
ncbi:MAG: hypothetical protein H7Y60_09955 [Rhodospirillaceae bacterium]|nr:hypothetical protein [Rhodospirillales bacterium]